MNISRKKLRKIIKEEIDSGNIGKLFYIEGDYIHAVPQKITEGWKNHIEIRYSRVYVLSKSPP